MIDCPIHKEALEVTSKIITFLGVHYNTLTGRCKRCRVVYLDQKIKGIAKFTYEGTNYQYLPELENWRVEQEYKKEEERKQAERKRQLYELHKKYDFLRSGNIKVRLHPNKANHCPEHGDKIEELNFGLYNDSGDKLMKYTGCYCSRCNALYLNRTCRKSLEKAAQSKLSIKIYGDDWNQTPPITVSTVQFPIRKSPEDVKKQIEEQKQIKKQKKLEKEQEKKQEFEKQQVEKYPFLKSGEVKIETAIEDPNHCLIHQRVLEVLKCILKENDRKQEFEFIGHYCPKCNCIYQKRAAEKKLVIYMKSGKQQAKYTVTPLGIDWEELPEIQVSELNLLNNCNQKENNIRTNDAASKSEQSKIKEDEVFDEKLFKLSAYQKFDREIAEVSAIIDGKETTVRILTLVRESDKYKCEKNEILIREAEHLGREILGRIAYNELEEFSLKGRTIKINNYKIWPEWEHHLDGFTKFCNIDQIQDITILSQKNLAQNSEEYEMVTALVYCANRNEPVYIDIYYSKRQNRYFINNESYQQYRVRYGLPYIHLVQDECDEMDYGNLRQNSELNLYGYTVAKSAEMTLGERQRLLQQLMDNGLMHKSQIVNHLEWLIHRQSGRITMEDACDCWKEDLKFVKDYRIHSQRKIKGRFIYGDRALKR